MNLYDPTPLILCVEDEEALRRDLADELAEGGYGVIEAANGAAALELIERQRPDLILCDISMPVMDGYELLRAVKTQPEDYADIPFVFLTALADRHQIVEGKLQGADDYLVKPIDYDLMLATVGARLRQMRSIRAPGPRAAAPLDALNKPGGAGDVLDLIATGIVLLDANGAVRFVNEAGRALAARCPELSIDARLSAGVPGSRRALALWVDALSQTSGDASLSSFALPRSEGRRDLMLVGCRLPVTDAGRADIAVFISDPDQPSPLAAEALGRQFGLTRAETRVATGLTRGMKPAEIAVDLGVSPTTIAFHLRNIFLKTDTNHQASLVALLLTGPAALLGRTGG